MNAAVEPVQSTTTPQDGHDGGTLDLAITGMTCASCVGRVEKVLSRVPGVTNASVNLATERAHVTGARPDLAALIRAVEKAGYGATQIRPEAPPADHQPGERRDLIHLIAAAVLTAPLLAGMVFPPLMLPGWVQFALALGGAVLVRRPLLPRRLERRPRVVR